MRNRLIFMAISGALAAACDDDFSVSLPTCAGDVCPPDFEVTDASRSDASACVPSGEICNGKDDNCDGEIDESFPEAGACGVAIGECRPGQRACRDGRIVCEGGSEPTDEICNGKDDDCDGVIDNDVVVPPGHCGAPNACGEIPAECMGGELVCLPAREPAPETCNGVDDDCDGTVDEELPAEEGIGQICGSATGICRPGTRACVEGALVCQGETPPAPETCNGLDDDCNGSIDDAPVDAGQPCGEGELCAGGLTVCEAGALRCEGARRATEEVCNGVDDDCDGEVDESDPMLMAPCGPDVGACVPGEIRCVAGSLLCFGGVSPTDESCDGEDNDCDGETDEADDVHGGGPCPAQGDACVESAQCGPDRRCVDDYGQRYCTPLCDAALPDECDAGYTCRSLGQSTICRRDYPPCLADAECGAGEHCMMIGGNRVPERLNAECRPALADGLPLNADCSADGAVCESNLCLGPMDRCSALCDASASCGEAFACIRTPFVIGNGDVVEVGLCLEGCHGDAQCDPAGTGRVCQYDLASGQEGIVGHCDAPREGNPVGDPCDLAADPPQRCDHGYCRRDASGRYCTQGCAEAADCPAGWARTQTPFNTEIGQVQVGICQRL